MHSNLLLNFFLLKFVVKSFSIKIDVNK